MPFLPNTWHSIELQSITPVAEWGGQAVTMFEEEDALITPEGTARWIYRRQTELWVVR